MSHHFPSAIPLVHGHEIPRIGFGTWPLLGDECAAMVEAAVQHGYRLFDTSFKYGNEADVASGLRASGIPRKSVFITSKFNKEDHSIDGVRFAYDRALRKMNLEYLDLYLIHWPVPAHGQYVSAWKGLVKLLEEGLVPAIGVSNFKQNHLDRIIEESGVVPDVNQIQLSVDIARTEIRSIHEQYGIQTQAWSPLGRGGELLSNPELEKMATRYGKTPAQLCLMWHVQQGIIPIPRASSLQHLAQNIDIFDAQLSPKDREILTHFDLGESAARDSDDPVNGH